jgi:hypothetical protein
MVPKLIAFTLALTIWPPVDRQPVLVYNQGSFLLAPPHLSATLLLLDSAEENPYKKSTGGNK